MHRLCTIYSNLLGGVFCFFWRGVNVFSQKSVSPFALCTFWRRGYVFSRQINTILKKRKPFDRSSSKVHHESWYYFPFRPVFKRKIYSPFSFIFIFRRKCYYPSTRICCKIFRGNWFFFFTLTFFFFFRAATFLTKLKKFWTELLLHDVYLVEIFHPLSCTSLRLEFFIAPGAHFYRGIFSSFSYFDLKIVRYILFPNPLVSLGVIYGVEWNRRLVNFRVCASQMLGVYEIG